MKKVSFDRLFFFAAVAEAKSIIRAASNLGISASTLSGSIRDLEASIGFELFVREARSVHLTPGGEDLLDRIAPSLAHIEADFSALREPKGRISGQLRMVMTSHAFRSVVWPRLRGLLNEYPDLQIEFRVEDHESSVAADEADMRVTVGGRAERYMEFVQISPPRRMIAVASPAYLQSCGVATHPSELIGHACIGSESLHPEWSFSRNAEVVLVKAPDRLRLNSPDAAAETARDGLGIAYLPEDIVESYVASGQLIRILDQWSARLDGYYLSYPKRRRDTPSYRMVIDALGWAECAELSA